MNEVANNLGASASIEKPVQDLAVKFPLFPEPTDEDFEDDIGDDERSYYKGKFTDLNTINSFRLHCTACDRHLGSSTRNESRMRSHPMLRTLVCHTCHTFYNSGEFEKGDDGSELYCRWCGQGGQVYCCSDCPHVFCAKCIKRNLGLPKIKEIENTDDWKCFKCNSKCLWHLRALCWALLRYCDLKNKITHNTQDPQLKDAYQKHCAVDHSECCKNKTRRKSDVKSINKKETDSAKKAATAIIPRIPATIQVKKFASISMEEPKEKKPQKRPASPVKNKPIFMKNPIAIAQCQKIITPVTMPPLKKIRMPMMAPVRIQQDKKPNPFIGQNTYTRIRPKAPPIMPIPIIPNSYNGFSSNNTYGHNSFNNMVVNDNINLSLESLTQGLDMAAVVAMSNNSNNQDDDVVCTPDFPLEPLCEVTEDNTDDDVQCMTPAPAVKQTQSQQQKNTTNSTPNYTRMGNNLPDVSPDNIIQMTEEDVSVNTQTGGLKFRVDPQTLSSNKMYRLPDGRIFAINSNPSMPGGYSATIVAVTETAGKPIAPKGATYAAKLSAVPSSTPKPSAHSNSSNKNSRAKASILRKSLNNTNRSNTLLKECDMSVSVEWYRFNLLEAIDSLEYSLGRLDKLKKQATTLFLRQRSLEEMRSLHRTLERVLSTSSSRFNEIRENLNRELKQYVQKKTGDNVSDDDDDVEILPDLNDDPIFIDENSMESAVNESNETQEVDLTGVGSSDHNTSVENKDDNDLNTGKDLAMSTDGDDNNSNSSKNENVSKEVENEYKISDDNNEKAGKGKENGESNSPIEKNSLENSNHTQASPETDNTTTNTEVDQKQTDVETTPVKHEILEQEDCKMESLNTDTEQESKIEKVIDNDTYEGIITEEPLKEIKEKTSEDLCDIKIEEKTQASEMTEGMIDNILKDEEKLPDPEMSEEMIEKLLKDENIDVIENSLHDKEMDVV